MLHLFQSNRLEILADQAAQLLRESPVDPFRPEYIVVQHAGMGRWLSLHLAARLGICAHVEFPLPAGFIWRMLEVWLPGVSADNAYAPTLVCWRLLEMLPELQERPGFEPVAHYLRTQGETAVYELARELARVLDEYMVYRPDWILRWQRNESAVAGDGWQAGLWRELVARTGDGHWADLLQRLQRAHRRGELSADSLPSRVVLFGLSSLTPGYLSLVQLLAEYIDVHLLLLNPCREYWVDIRDAAEVQRRLLASSDDEELYLDVGNPLLAAWGRQGRDFFAQILALDPGSEERYQPPQGGGLLQRIQRDILDLTGPDSGERFIPVEGDESLRLHSCHSPMREVEVLHDQLLDLFERQRDIDPGDVLVMTPDMDLYAPYIEAIFGEAGEERRIPFNLADRSGMSGAPLIEAFLQLTAMPTTRYEANRMLALLETPALARRFGLESGDLPLIAGWMEQAGIRWGRDAQMKERLGLPPEGQNSWRFGLDRMLLGYALPAAEQQLFGAVLPFDEIEGSQAELLGGLAAFAEAVFSLEQWLAGEYGIAEWCERLRLLLDRFFLPDEADEPQLMVIREQLQLLSEQGTKAQSAARLGVDTVRLWLRDQFHRGGARQPFLAGGVSFCALTPLRSLPFRVICLIGMNDGAFPREQRSFGFDLLADDVRLGDRSRRADDRYLFLETLLSARDRLYISYTGQDLRDNTRIPPSTMVNELLDYAKQLLIDCNQSELLDDLLTRHPLQPFSPRYFRGEPGLFSYSPLMAAASSTLQDGKPAPSCFFTAELLAEPEPHWRQVELSQLLRFFANPARFLLRERLAISLEWSEGELESRDPFELGRFAATALQDRMVEHLLAGEAVENLLAIEQGAGRLPHGAYGSARFESLADEAAAFALSLGDVDRQMREPLPFDLQIGMFRLTGQLQEFGNQGLLSFGIGAPVASAQVQFWIRHLILNCLRPEDTGLESRWMHSAGQYRLQPVAAPESLLAGLLDLYWEGLRQPLHFFPKSAMAYMESQAGGKERAVSLAKASYCWSGEFNPFRECDNPYHAFAFRGGDVLDARFEELSERILAPMLALRETL